MKNLIDLLKEKKIKGTELAKEIGILPEELSRFYNERTKNKKTLEKIESYLGERAEEAEKPKKKTVTPEDLEKAAKFLRHNNVKAIDPVTIPNILEMIRKFGLLIVLVLILFGWLAS